MARIRTVKPEFWGSRQVCSCSLEARLLFIGLWNFVDDGGVCHDDAEQLKIWIFPGGKDGVTEEAVGSWLNELVAVGLLDRFHADGHDYLYVTGWHHQKIDKPKLKHPQPSDGVGPDGGGPRGDGGSNGGERSRSVGNGREASGNGRDQSRPVATSRDPSRQEGKGGEGSNNSREAESEPVSTSAASPGAEPVDAAVGLITVFDDCRARVFGDGQRRGWAAPGDHPVAVRWLKAGVTVATLKPLMLSIMGRMRAKGRAPPDMLSYFDKPVREQIVEGGGSGRAGGGTGAPAVDFRLVAVRKRAEALTGEGRDDEAADLLALAKTDLAKAYAEVQDAERAA
ncbi:MAG: hypothetical protein AAFX92_03830 [Pseudomonadota bacterium]